MKPKPTLLFLFVFLIVLSPCTIAGVATLPFGLVLLGINALIAAGVTSNVLKKEEDKERQRKANQAIIDMAERECDTEE